MSEITTGNDDNHSVAASDFVQLDQPDEMPDQDTQQQQQGQSQFGLRQNPPNWTMNTGSTHNNYQNVLKEQKLMIEKLEANIQTLQANVKNLELEAKIRAMEENAEQNAKYQALGTKFAQMLATQNEGHHKEMDQLKDGFAKEMAQLEDKNRKLEEKVMSNLEVETTKNVAIEEKMEQLQSEFSKVFAVAEQQKQMMAQFQAQFHSLELKLKEAEQRAQTGKNELKEIIQQKMDKFRAELDKNGQQAIGSNLNKSKILANPKCIVWDWDGLLNTKANLSPGGLKVTATDFCVFATEGYVISAEAEHCRKDNFQFAGTIVYYYEVALTPVTGYSSIGFTDGSESNAGRRVGGSPNSYGIGGFDDKYVSLWLSGKKHKLCNPIGCWVGTNDIGCGLLLNSKNELAVFFTLNGFLLVKQTPIHPTVDRLYPTARIYDASVEANFGGNLVDKRFVFDIDKWPGLVFE